VHTSSSPYIQRHTELSANVLAFCRYLRSKGLPLGPGEVMDALQALAHTPMDSRESMRMVLKAVLARSRPQQSLFDEWYEEYWQNLAKAVDAKVKQGPEATETPAAKRQEQDPALQSLKSWLYGKGETEEVELAAYSGHRVMTQVDFAAFAAGELEEVMRLIHDIARKLATRLNRRYHRLAQSGQLDFRKTMRLNLRRGGELLDLAFRQRRIRKPKLVMLCDVSKSMDLYSQFLVQFMYAFQSVYARQETFVFSTSLHRITEALQLGSFEQALNQLAEAIPDWSGGTRIGESLQQFVDVYAPGMLDRNTIVLILSDGWDTGDTALLEGSMQYLHKRAARVIWLNPLAGNPAYQPTAKGMEVALPFIDVFAPGHNVESLRALGRKL